jgi:hypothetical protein
VRLAMSADKSRASHLDAATSVVVHVCAPNATGRFPGLHARIDAGRACLVMSPTGEADR